jgi:hypothetical protein
MLAGRREAVAHRRRLAWSLPRNSQLMRPMPISLSMRFGCIEFENQLSNSQALILFDLEILVTVYAGHDVTRGYKEIQPIKTIRVSISQAASSPPLFSALV